MEPPVALECSEFHKKQDINEEPFMRKSPKTQFQEHFLWSIQD